MDKPVRKRGRQIKMRTRVRLMMQEQAERERAVIAKHIHRFACPGLHQWGFAAGTWVDDKRTTDSWGIGN